MKALEARVSNLEAKQGGGVVCFCLAHDDEPMADALRRIGVDTGGMVIHPKQRCVRIGRTVYLGLDEADRAI